MDNSTLRDDSGQGRGVRRRRRPIGLRLAGVSIAALTAAAIVILGGGLFHFARAVSDFDRVPGAGQADAIVALTGGAARISDAVDLLDQGRAARLLITGVHPDNTTESLASFVHGRHELFACCVDLGYTALNTVGNAKEARNWARHHGYRSLIVVTSSYHLPRSLNELRREMPEGRFIPHPVAADGPSDDEWWRDAASARLMLSEYAKYLMSVVRLRWRPATTDEAAIAAARAGG